MTFVRHALLLVLATAAIAGAQVKIAGAMAVNAVSFPSLYDYLNTNYATSAGQNGAFGSAVSFSGEITAPVAGLHAGAEALYLTDSYNYPSLAGQYSLAYGILAVTAVVYTEYTGNGYFFRLGGGAGPVFLALQETRPPSSVAAEYASTGFSIALKADANTALGTSAYASIGAEVRYCSCGEPSSGGTVIPVNFNQGALRVSGITAGLRLGIIYVL